MWSKITSALKPLTTSKDESAPSLAHSEVLNKVYEQHPNLSMFHANESGVVGRQSLDGNSPSVHSKKSMFRRLSKPTPKEDIDLARSLQQPPMNSKSSKHSLDASQTSQTGELHEVVRRSSFDLLRPSPPRHNQDTTRSVKDSRRRPSLDLLRDDSLLSQVSHKTKESPTDSDFLSPGQDKFGHSSVRSILRDRNTPGTGQNVRFFSRNEFKVITPEQSLSLDILDKPQPPIPKDEDSFLDRLMDGPQSGDSPSSKKPSSTKLRPKLAGLFAPSDDHDNPSQSASLSPANEYSNLFETSGHLDMPSFPPAGLDFDVNAAAFGSTPFDMSANDISYVVRDDHLDGQTGQMTSTPPKSTDLKGKGKEQPADGDDQQISVNRPTTTDETIFHGKEKPQNLTSPLHERSQSLSFGQTVFYSMVKGDDKSSEELEAAYPSSDIRPSVDFGPEADINVEPGAEIIVDSGGPSEPDPFSANANTYYTPQVNIPVTPPRGLRHLRTTSKEESLIISLQTELTMKKELCQQYETELKAQDELVEILSKKLSDVDKEEGKRKATLKSWKKKVQELQRTCRQLEEAIDRSRQESVERSVMDEASGEALRMLHKQIASLESEKTEWAKKEFVLREDLETLETLVRERSEDVMNLKETLWSRDENERELKEGLQEAKEQMDLIGNISLVGVDEDELKRLMMEREQKTSEETQRFKMKELQLQQEVEEMKTKYEWLEVQKNNSDEQFEGLNQLLTTKEDEYATLKAELEAQWQHTETMSEKIETLKQQNADLVIERDALKGDVGNLELQIMNMENDWEEGENRKQEIEADLQEVWNLNDALQQERDKLEDALQQERDAAKEISDTVQQRESHIAQLNQEKQFADDRITRLEESLRQREEEVTQYTQRFVNGEAEVEHLREEMSKLKRDHSHVVNEQTRELRDASDQQQAMQHRMESFIRAQAEADIESKRNIDRATAAQDELERLRRQVHALQQDSADKDIKIVQMTKQVSQEKEDNLGLNIALESKQQELELIKRKLNVRGTAGSTPAQPSKAIHRKDSNIFMATPLTRPPSAMSEDTIALPKRNWHETPLGPPTKLAFAKNTRVSNSGMSSVPSSTPRGSMGPPPLKPRPSINGTPTPAVRAGINRSSSAKSVTSPTNTPIAHRRTTSAASSDTTPAKTSKSSRTTVNASPAPSTVSEEDEKENLDSTSSRRRSMISIVS